MVATDEDEAYGLRCEIGRLEVENAKLRKLLHEALLFGDDRSYQKIRYRLKREARELGVEVDK